MGEIKCGEYIRTKQGYIAKFIHVNNTYGFLEFDKTIWKEGNKPKSTISFSDFKKRVTKHSSNIINLIEVGDLIHLIIPPDEYYNKSIETLWYLQDGMLNNTKNSIELKELQLLGIITKQQLALMEYKLDN